MQITSSTRVEDTPRVALRRIAERWRARAVIAESLGAEDLSTTMHLTPDSARALAREVDVLCDFAARLEAQQVALAAIRVRQARSERWLAAVAFAEWAACCAALLWIQWHTLSGVSW